MGTAYSQWLKAKEGTLSAAEINLERRLHELLLHQQRRQDGVKKQAASERQRHKRRALAPEVPNDCKVVPLPQEVVSDECIAVLEAARAAKEVTIKAYIARALAAEPVVDMMDATVCGTRHQLPRVSLTEALSVQEFKAIEKQYVSARHLPHKKALIQRTQKVLEQVEQLSGVKDSDYAVVDATGFLSGIFVRKAYSCAGRRGRRALAALNFMKGMQGYMKCCSGSGALTGHDERNLLKYKERLVAYGLSADKHPTELAISGTLERPQNGSAQLYYYEEKNGRCHSFQAGAWLARRELLIEEVRHELGAFGLEAHLPDVLVFLEESKRVLRKYGALLLVGGQDEVPEDQIDPELDAELLWKILSMVVIDSGNKSRFGVHTDTPQIAPCLCTAESMYAPGFYDYTGGELCFYNGMYADDYGPEGCLLLSGHPACKRVGDGGIVKLPRGTLPLEILKKLDRLFLEGQLFWDKLERATPRLVQEIGPGSAAWDQSVAKLLLPWVSDQLVALQAPPTMAVADSPTSVLLATVTASTKMRAGGGQLAAHQDYARSEYPGEAGWNFLVLMNDTDELEACQVAWMGSRDSPDTSKGHSTRAWLDANFERVSLTGEWGTVYVFDCATWHAVERMLPRARVHATRSSPPAVKRTIGKPTHAGCKGASVEVRARTSLVIDCRTAGLPAPHMVGDRGERVWMR